MSHRVPGTGWPAHHDQRGVLGWPRRHHCRGPRHRGDDLRAGLHCMNLSSGRRSGAAHRRKSPASRGRSQIDTVFIHSDISK